MGRRTGRRLAIAGGMAIVLLKVGLTTSNDFLVIASMVLAGGAFIRLLATWE